MDDLKALKLNKPPKLVEVRTRNAHDSLGMIQLIFEGGIQSPVFDCERGKDLQVKSYAVKARRLSSVKIRVNKNTILNQIYFSYEEGSEDDVSGSYFNGGNPVT